MRRETIIAGDGILHPVPLVAIAVLLVNDHLLKGSAPGILTGVLSDIAGLMFFPLAIVAVLEHLRGRRFVVPSRSPVLVAVALTAVAFGAINTSMGADRLYEQAQGWLRLGWRPVVNVADTRDLLALPALIVPLFLGLRRARSAREVQQAVERVVRTDARRRPRWVHHHRVGKAVEPR